MAQRDDSDSLGFTTAEHLKMTGGGHFTGGRVGAAHVGASAEPPLTGTPEYTRRPRVKVSGDPRTGTIRTFEHGTGPGWTAFHSPDLNEFQLRGDGVHPKGRWPESISKQMLLIHSGEPADGGSNNADQILGFGLPSARTHKPRKGAYIRRENNSTPNLLVPFTDADGEDYGRDDMRNLIVNGTPMPQVRYIDLPYSDFAAVGGTDPEVTLSIRLRAKTEVLAVGVEVITPLDGGAIATVVADVGGNGTTDRYQTGSVELHNTGGAAPGDMQYSPQPVPDFDTAEVELTVTLHADGDCADLNTGTIRVWLKVQAWQ
jgi:hypothetical protein